MISVTPTDVFNGFYGLNEDAVGILSVAPDEVGSWRILTIATIRGVKLLMPNKQTVVHASNQVYTLLPKTDVGCQEVTGG